MSERTEIGVSHVTVPICDLCLGGAGGECHVPECVFWMCPAPTKQQAEWIRNHAFTQIVKANLDAFDVGDEA